MYWAAAQLQPQRDTLALHFLRQAGFETYAPRLRERSHVTLTPCLDPLSHSGASSKWARPMLEIAIALIVGFALGYGVPEWVSRRPQAER
jgi:hypothetical protein